MSGKLWLFLIDSLASGLNPTTTVCLSIAFGDSLIIVEPSSALSKPVETIWTFNSSFAINLLESTPVNSKSTVPETGAPSFSFGAISFSANTLPSLSTSWALWPVPANSWMNTFPLTVVSTSYTSSNSGFPIYGLVSPLSSLSSGFPSPSISCK